MLKFGMAAYLKYVLISFEWLSSMTTTIFLLTARVSLVLQMAFVWIFLQELITGKGVIQGIQEGNLFFLANAGIFGVSVLTLTVWLAIKGANDYTKDA
jgi:hypothetical protein